MNLVNEEEFPTHKTDHPFTIKKTFWSPESEGPQKGQIKIYLWMKIIMRLLYYI